MVDCDSQCNLTAYALEDTQIRQSLSLIHISRDSGVFIIGDVKYSLLPRTLAVMAAALLKKHFSATDLAKAYADFYIAFLATVEVAREDSDEEETGKEDVYKRQEPRMPHSGNFGMRKREKMRHPMRIKEAV